MSGCAGRPAGFRGVFDLRDFFTAAIPYCSMIASSWTSSCARLVLLSSDTEPSLFLAARAGFHSRHRTQLQKGAQWLQTRRDDIQDALHVFCRDAQVGTRFQKTRVPAHETI